MRLENIAAISFISIKGDVGKTTSAANGAATLANRQVVVGKTIKDARVRLVNLDPQSNATTSLINDNKYNLIKSRITLSCFLFREVECIIHGRK